uniref:Alpha-tocopherol transfer protein n=1 Tax=Cacopsylla melanoneura TaxID=428564 RepID=A0A8D8SZF8_9HEMI
MALIPPDTAQRKAILSAMNATEDDIDSSKKLLREWLNQNPHLPQNISDNNLYTFVVQSKNRMQKAKDWMESYYTRHLSGLPDIFANLDPADPEIQESFDIASLAVCRQMTPEGQRIQIFRLQDADPSKYIPMATAKRTYMIMDIRFTEEPREGGEVVIFDMTEFSLEHLVKLTPMHVKRMIQSLKVVPLRLKKLIFINAPSMMDTLFMILKTFLDEKLKKRLYVYSGDHTNLYQHVPKHILPREYGGDDLPMTELSEYWRSRLLKARDWFLDETIQQADESKRIGDIKRRLGQDIFGVEGSFKNILID